jgi:nucleoside-diphosphate-sugar epimerase
MASINQFVDIVEEIAGITLKRTYDLTAPKGLNGRNGDNTLTTQLLGWAPGISLCDGVEKTCQWIYDEMSAIKVHGVGAVICVT